MCLPKVMQPVPLPASPFLVFPPWRQELLGPPPEVCEDAQRIALGPPCSPSQSCLCHQGGPLGIFFPLPPPLSLDFLEGSRGLSPGGVAELSKASRSPRGDPEAPVNCSSCPGPPATSSQRPAPQLLQLLLRTNLSNRQTLLSGARASPSLHLRLEGTFPGEPGASQLPRLSPGPSIFPGASSLPPASPGAPPGPPPLTPEPSSSASRAHTASRRPTTALPGASALSTTGTSPSETPVTLLRPRRLSAALAATGSSGPQPPTTGTSREEEPTG